MSSDLGSELRGDLRGSSPQIELRRLAAGQTNFETMSQTFTANIGNSPTIVFSSKWSWPTQSGIPLLRPDAWGSVGGRLRVPFSKPWAYSGKNSILADYSFRGGTLANAATWNTRTPGYYLDGEDLHRDYRYGSIDVIPELMQRRQCADSAFAPRTAATAGAGAIAYGRSSPMIALRGKLEFGHYSFWTAPGALVIHALGLAGSTKGVDIGAGCNRLYVDIGQPTVYVPLQTGTSAGLCKMKYVVPFIQPFSGVDIYVQAAWADSRTNAFKLTSAVRTALPIGLPPDRLTYKSLYQNGATKMTGIGPYSDGYVFPYTLWRTK